MNPQELFCPNMDCPARGWKGKGNLQVHSQKDQRCLCKVCGQTFATSKGTIFYRLRHAPELVIQVLVLLAYGCPIQAIVKAFCLDERTVRDWHARAGKHCQQVHEHLVENTVHDLKQVQADEIKVKTQKGTFWMALAIWVQPRLWIGGVVSPKRDLDLIQALADKVKQMALCRPLLLAVDGLASYVSAFRNAFRSKLPRSEGETGRCKLVSWQDIAIAQVIKQRLKGVLQVERRIAQGAEERVERLIQTTQGKGVINTAFIERLNATFRQRISTLTRRTRNLAQRAETLVAGMYLVGCFYNFCDFHRSLRLKLSVGSFGHRWVPLPPWQLPKQRGRPSTALLQLAHQWAN